MYNSLVHVLPEAKVHLVDEPSLFNVENEPTNAPSFYILTIDQLMGVKHNEIPSGLHQFVCVLASHTR